MKVMKAPAFAVVGLVVAFFLTGCSQKILDYRNATIENGKIYSGDENKPFSGKVTNVPELDLLQSQEGFQQFLRPVVRSNDNLNHLRGEARRHGDAGLVEGVL